MSKTILCADDSVTMQTVAEITFRATEYEYVGARSADEALEKARANKPALILADLEMPDKDGYELCQAVKKDPALADVPVMMMHGKSQTVDDARAAEVGADGSVVKPWDSQVMLDKVGELLEKVSQAGVAKVGGAPAEAPAPEPAATPAPEVGFKPMIPNLPAGAGRSATIMGMPTIKMPPKVPAVGVTPVMPKVPAIKPPASKPAPAVSKMWDAVDPATIEAQVEEAKVEVAKPAPIEPPAPEPPKPEPPAPEPPKPEPPKPVAVTPPQPAAPMAAAVPTGLPEPPRGMPRPPMIKGIPRKRAAGTVRHAVAARVSDTAAEVAREAGLDPSGPEMAALVKLSRDVVERIVWEVVPDLAETIIRENLDKLAKN